jgi:hypothetical protein
MAVLKLPVLLLLSDRKPTAVLKPPVVRLKTSQREHNLCEYRVSIFHDLLSFPVSAFGDLS